MKVKLLRRIRNAAHNAAHINSITTITDWSGEHRSGVEIGYGVTNYQPYRDLFNYNMDETTFNRLVRIKYWELNKDYWYKKFKKNN